MRHGHVVAIDGVAMRGVASFRRAARREMRHDLMTMQIEVDPLRIGAPFRTSENASVKCTCRGKIIDWESKMKTWHSIHDSLCLIRGAGRV